MAKLYKAPITLAALPPSLTNIEYAVRGPIVSRANELEEAMKHAPPGAFPKFDHIIYANIGNPQKAGQPSVTYIRQLLAALLYPRFLDFPGVAQDFPSDITTRAKKYIAAAGGSLGCYSASKGIPLFRDEVADWLEKRDGVRPDAESIVLTNGASTAVKFLLELTVRDSRDGIMIPVPEYPLYTATVTQLGGSIVPYYLDEKSGWALRPEALQEAVTAARNKGIEPRCLVAINPGNPTGTVLKQQGMQDVLDFCLKENLLLIADEVYQQNVYDEKCEFVSFRSLMMQRSLPLQLVSLHSASKGLFGECGLRGGLMQLENVDNDVMGVLYKLCSISLCANTIGQATMAAVVSPPREGDPSHPLYVLELRAIFEALRRKAKLATEYLNSVDGLSCQPIQGALYAYPRIDLPDGALVAARSRNVQPDMLFCMELLDSCGIACVPGSGFGQEPGTWHLRLTILPTEEDFEPLLSRFVEFYKDFVDRYSKALPLDALSKESDADSTCGDSSSSN